MTSNDNRVISKINCVMIKIGGSMKAKTSCWYYWNNIFCICNN